MDLRELYKGCRTYRRFLQDPVPEEVLDEMMENVRIARSAANKQPLRYVVVTDPGVVAQMQDLVRWGGAVPKELGTPKEGEQPTAFVVLTKEPGNSWADIDIGIAVNMLATTAWARGIGSCIMGAVNKGGIARLLDIPQEDEEVKLVLALGKPAHKSTVVDVPESGKLAYYLDDERNYYVPKRALADIVRKV